MAKNLTHDDPREKFIAALRKGTSNGPRTPSKGLGALCPLCFKRSGMYESPCYRIVDTSPLGRAEYAWMKATNILTDIELDSPSNTLPLCNDHHEAWQEGVIALCPTLRDLQLLVQWEEEDWERRSTSSEPTTRTTPPIDNLSGRFSCLWLKADLPMRRGIGDLDNGCTDIEEYQPDGFCVHPQQVLFVRNKNKPAIIPVTVSRRSGATGELFGHFELQFEKVEYPRINPFVMLVRAMAALNDAYTPATILYARYPHEKPAMQLQNPLKDYERILLRLRSLYSRIDPATAETFIPPLGLGTETTLEDQGTSDDDSDSSFPRRGRAAEDDEIDKEGLLWVLLEQGSRCLLCGTTDQLVVHRVVGEHDLQQNPISWLKPLRLLAREYHLNDTTNLMTLCEPHADAYDLRVWGWMPSRAVRDEMLQHAVEMKDVDHSNIKDTPATGGAERDPAGEPLVEGGGTPETSAEFTITRTAFDVVIYLPRSMPDRDICSGPNIVGVERFQGGNPQRVFPGWSLPLNPYVVFGVALRMVGAAYLPLPDAAMLDVEAECLKIREILNDKVPKGPPRISAAFREYFIVPDAS